MRQGCRDYLRYFLTSSSQSSHSKKPLSWETNKPSHVICFFYKSRFSKQLDFMPFSLTKRIIGFVSGFGGIAGGCDYNPGDCQSAQWQRPDPPKLPWEPHTSDQLVTLTYSRICPQIHRKEKSKSNQSGTHLICTDIHREITVCLIKFMNMYGITSLAESCAMYDIHNTCSTFLFWRLIAADPHKRRILSPSCSSLRMEIKKLGRFFECLHHFGAKILLQVKIQKY